MEVDYGRGRFAVGECEEPFIVGVVAKLIVAQAMNVTEDFQGLDDELSEEARAECERVVRLVRECVPSADLSNLEGDLTKLGVD